MRVNSGKNVPFWMESARFPEPDPMSKFMSRKICDVCVVGAGITGLTCAYLLSKEGKSVIVVDDGAIASGETARTTAHLTSVLDTHYIDLERLHGSTNVKLAYASHAAAIDKIQEIVEEHSIDCDFVRVDGYLISAEPDHDALLEKEFAACTRAGFSEIEILNSLPPPVNIKSPVIRFPNQAQFHVLKYLEAVTDACIRHKVKLFDHARVVAVDDRKHPVQVKTLDGSVIEAESVIVATNSPITDFVKIHTKQAAYRSYVIGCLVKKDVIPLGLYWDTQDPYHYARLYPALGGSDYQLLIVGGEDHKTGQSDDAEARFGRLYQWARQVFPPAGEIEYRWSGQLYEPVDGLGYAGKDPAHKSNVYICTGHSGNGMTHATLSAMVLTDTIMARSNPWSGLYDPARKPLAAPLEYIRENANAIWQYSALLKPSEKDSADDLKPGEGAIVVRNGQRIAVCRDMNGVLKERSAYCPHLKGVVCWNSFEQSWDCPVHGSRFTADGQLLNGPANSDLPPPASDEQRRRAS